MKLTVATGDYAHTRPLADTALSDEAHRDLELVWLPGRPGAIFREALGKDAPFDVAEMSLATAWALRDRRDRRFVALPVFPSRMYRLSAFYVGDGVGAAADLAGGRMGVVRYGQTAAVWARVLLAERFGLRAADMQWWVAERQDFEPPGLTLHDAGSMEKLEAMLLQGRLHCLLATSVPKAYLEGRVRRLFPDWAAEELSLYRESGRLPIMHTVIVKTVLIETHPWLPSALMSRFEAAKRAALDWLADTDATSLPVPLQHAWIDTAAGIRGEDLWPYGIAPNQDVLDKFADHMHAQGLTSRRISPDEVFHPA
jgi:4,5-dihydroxyphthalate decarboxylase